MAGVGRFELPHARVKVLCLTAWRYPTIAPNKSTYLYYHKKINCQSIFATNLIKFYNIPIFKQI